jgi:hypothetical protein
MSKRIIFVVNDPSFFLSHRLPIALGALEAGYHVRVATADGNGVAAIKDYGFTHYVLPLSRSGRNPFSEIVSVAALVKLFRRVSPELVHLATIKPVLYGGLAARIVGISCVLSAVSGLGTVFVAGLVPAKARKWLVTRLYAMAFNQKRLTVIFQNPEDRDTLLAAGALRKDETRMIRGSGG